MCVCAPFLAVYVLCVQERIQRGKYRSVADMQDDVLLLCRNARTYNQEGSQIYIDSQVIRSSSQLEHTLSNRVAYLYFTSMVMCFSVCVCMCVTVYVYNNIMHACDTVLWYVCQELERAFMEVKVQVESGLVECGDSDDDQTREVSSLLTTPTAYYNYTYMYVQHA